VPWLGHRLDGPQCRQEIYLIRIEPAAAGHDLRTFECDGCVPCLTVTADLLDEVLLGFSSEPIVYGVLLPHLESIGKPNFSLELPPLATGHRLGKIEEMGRYIYVIRRFISSTVKSLSAPVYRAWQRYLSTRLMRLITSTAFGLSLHEMRNAHISSSNRIHEPEIFDEYIWDVTKHLVQDSSYVTSEREARYSFLWNPEELAERTEKSKLWHRVRQRRGDIDRYYGSYAVRSMDSDSLSKTCVILEERLKEAIGAIGLTQMAYHSDSYICERIADFIAYGLIPTEAVRVNSSSL